MHFVCSRKKKKKQTKKTDMLRAELYLRLVSEQNDSSRLKGLNRCPLHSVYFYIFSKFYYKREFYYYYYL